jgi:hypothetical protein
MRWGLVMHCRMRGGWKASLIIGGSLIFASVTADLAQARPPLTKEEKAQLADPKFCWSYFGPVLTGQELRKRLEDNIKGGIGSSI